jgi:hypothetical protein
VKVSESSGRAVSDNRDIWRVKSGLGNIFLLV